MLTNSNSNIKYIKATHRSSGNSSTLLQASSSKFVKHQMMGAMLATVVLIDVLHGCT
jgi:hypothetical protein